ncbi:MAG TPA: ABC transporter ATP-binding protein [candidate division Zixibacteria bacterium]|nr:ABC transporter ATP-binding protein [candidate division Zixibacteria bacterium]
MKLYWKLLKYLRPHLKYLIAAVICMVIYAALSGFSLTMIVPFTKIVLTSQLEDSPATSKATTSQESTKTDESLVVLLPQTLKKKFNQWLLADSKIESLKRLCIFILLVFLIKNIFWYLQSFLIVQVEQGVIMDLRNQLYSHYHNLPLEYFHGKKSGVLISRLTNDINLVRGAVANGFAEAIRQIFLYITYMFLVIWASWKLSLIVLVLLPFGIIIISKFGKKVKKNSILTQQKMGNLTSVLQETIYGIRVIKAFAMEKFELEKFKNFGKDYFKTMVKLTRIGSLAPPLTEMLGVLAGVTILWFGGKQILGGSEFTVDRFFLFLVALFSLMQPVKKLSHVNIDIQQGLAAAERIFEVLETEPKIKNSPQPVKVNSLEKEINFEDILFHYDSHKSVLQEINLKVKRGEIIAVVGPSGAGKSTLMDLLVRFYDPQEGKITIDGTDVRKIELNSLRNLLGIVTQETMLFNDSVWNNIAYGHNGASTEMVEKAARTANAHDFIVNLPESYQTVIGDRGVKVSGGERQRLAIARAIFKNPPILIFDEATSSLDSESEKLVQEAIEHLMHGRTVFVIAHRLSTVQNADRIVVLDKGRIVQVGKHAELIRQEGLYKKLYNLQFKA